MYNRLLKYSIRSVKRQSAYIIINVLGLSIGLACSLLIALYPGVLSFVEGLIIALGLAIFTVSFKVLRAARRNPAESLNYE